MYPLSDKDLDRLSKEAAEQYDVEQNTSGWEQLEQKLNKYLPSTKRDKRRFLFFLFLIALLSGGGLFWILTGEQEKPPYVQTDNAQPNIPDANSNPSVNRRSDNQNANKPENKSEKTSTEKITQPSGTTSEAETVPVSAAGFEKARAVLAKNNQNERIDAERKTRDKTGLNKLLTTQKVNSNTQQPPIVIKKEEIKIREERQDVTDKPVTVSDQPKTNPDVQANTPEADKVVKDNKTDAVTLSDNKRSSKQKNQKVKKYPLEIGLVAAPDFSNVKFTHSDNTGINYGLQIAYRFSKRLSVNTGLLFTNKNYTAHGKDYHPPKGHWLYNPNVRLDLVDGDCSMFDIPLNIRYDLFVSNKHRYFISSGISSYLMKNENYLYYYAYNGTNTQRHSSYDTDKKDWLSIVNFSAGYERLLNKNFSVQAEPYLKVPARGVGFGSMQLNSYGIYFSVKYKPGFNASSSGIKK